MPALQKINTLKSFRFFNDFCWTSDCVPFAKHNIIYGWNGSGKTTLCDFFKSIEKDSVCPADAVATFRITENIGTAGKDVGNKGIQGIANYIKVFDQFYIRNSIYQSTGPSKIFVIGEGQGHLLEVVKKIKNKISELAIKKEQQEKVLKEKEQLLDKRKIVLAERYV